MDNSDDDRPVLIIPADARRSPYVVSRPGTAARQMRTSVELVVDAIHTGDEHHGCFFDWATAGQVPKGRARCGKF